MKKVDPKTQVKLDQFMATKSLSSNPVQSIQNSFGKSGLNQNLAPPRVDAHPRTPAADPAVNHNGLLENAAVAPLQPSPGSNGPVPKRANVDAANDPTAIPGAGPVYQQQHGRRVLIAHSQSTPASPSGRRRDRDGSIVQQANAQAAPAASNGSNQGHHNSNKARNNTTAADQAAERTKQRRTIHVDHIDKVRFATLDDVERNLAEKLPEASILFISELTNRGVRIEFSEQEQAKGFLERWPIGSFGDSAVAHRSKRYRELFPGEDKNWPEPRRAANNNLQQIATAEKRCIRSNNIPGTITKEALLATWPDKLEDCILLGDEGGWNRPAVLFFRNENSAKDLLDGKLKIGIRKICGTLEEPPIACNRCDRCNKFDCPRDRKCRIACAKCTAEHSFNDCPVKEEAKERWKCPSCGNSGHGAGYARCPALLAAQQRKRAELAKQVIGIMNPLVDLAQAPPPRENAWNGQHHPPPGPPATAANAVPQAIVTNIGEIVKQVAEKLQVELQQAIDTAVNKALQNFATFLVNVFPEKAITIRKHADHFGRTKATSDPRESLGNPRPGPAKPCPPPASKGPKANRGSTSPTIKALATSVSETAANDQDPLSDPIIKIVEAVMNSPGALNNVFPAEL